MISVYIVQLSNKTDKHLFPKMLTHFKDLFLLFLVCTSVYFFVRLCGCECRCLWKQEASDPPGVRDIGSFESPYAGPGK